MTDRPGRKPDQNQPTGLRARFGWLRGRRLLAIPAFAAIAILPWLFPWHQALDASPSSDPSSVIKQATQDQPADTTPDESAVSNVAKQARGATGYDLPVSAAEVAQVSTKPGPYEKLGRIQIPKVNLDSQFGEGVFDQTLEKGPGHWPGTPMPGRPGNSVISGHRNTHTQPFKYLNLLNPGDKIIVTVGNGSPVTYSVTKTTIVPQAKYKDFVLRQPSDPSARQITLFACHPEGNPIYRIVVQASASPVSG